MEKTMIQITAGDGPAECCRVVACLQGLMMKEAKRLGIDLTVLEKNAGELKGTLSSTLMLATGNNLASFVKEWTGTIQWIAQSPYRKYHKRKNWFVGVNTFAVPELLSWDAKEVKFETCRSSGPGGQNVNKVETAVRGIHLPSGIQVMAMDSRSQLANKKLCLLRLQQKVVSWQTEQLLAKQQTQWQAHHGLARGNPIKTIKQDLL